MPQSIQHLVKRPVATLPFTDGRTCKDWLKLLPVTNIVQTQQIIHEALREMGRGQLASLERLTCLELMREKVAYLQAEQRARFSGKTIPLSHGDMMAWETSRTLVESMETGYRGCFDEATGGASDLAAHLALVIQRIMRYIGLQMLFSGMIYRRFDPVLWARLHQLWVEAEGRHLTLVRVKDSVGSVEGTSSVTEAYTAILLARMANVHELAPRQIDFVDALLKRFSAKVTIESDPVACGTGPLLCVDLFGTEGVSVRVGEEAVDHLRFLNMAELSLSLRRRIAKLQVGEPPVNLNLPTEWTAQEILPQMWRLHRIWCEGIVTRRSGIVPRETGATLAFGINETHYFVTGDVFEQPGKKRELTRQELNDIAMFGKISETTMRARYADFNFATETWGVVEEGRGYVRLMRPSNSTRGVAIGRLVGVRLGEGGMVLLSVVREIVQELDGAILAVLGLLPGKPEAVAVSRPPDLRTHPGTQYLQGLRLPAMPSLKEPESLFVPAGLTQPGRTTEIVPHGQYAGVQLKLGDFAERGADFDRFIVLEAN